MTSLPLFQDIFISRRARVASFADIMEIVTMFIKRIIEDSKKVTRIRNHVSKCNPYQINLLISSEKC